MSYDDILADYDELEHDDILAVLEYVALDPAVRASRFQVKVAMPLIGKRQALFLSIFRVNAYTGFHEIDTG